MGVAPMPAGGGEGAPILRLAWDAGAAAGGSPAEGTADAAHGAPEDAGGDALHAPRVLVADDERSMRLLLGVSLGLAGFEVVEASTGREALERAATEELDVVLLDVMMPDVGGHDVALQLRRRVATSKLPIVFVSARASREDLRIGYELGGLDYIVKPFDR